MGLLDKIKFKNTKDEFLWGYSRKKESSKNIYEIVCPYCFYKFEHDVVHFRSSNETVIENDEKLIEFYKPLRGVNVDGRRTKVLVPAQMDVSQLIYNDKGMLKGVKENVAFGKETYERLCPYCHNSLPVDAGKKPMKVISVVGSTSVGKTVYMLKLLHSRTLLADGSINLLKIDGHTHIDSQYAALKRNGFEATKNVYIEPMSFQATINNSDNNDEQIVLSFFDFPGEQIDQGGYYLSHGRHLLNASAIMFLLDSTQTEDVRNYFRMTNMTNKEIENNGNLMGYDAAFAALFERVFGSGNQEKFEKPTAVVFTKIDEIEKLLREDIIRNEPNAFPKFSKSSFFSEKANSDFGYVDLDKIEQRSQSIKMFLQDVHEHRFISNIENNCNNIKYFGVSALGNRPEEGIAFTEDSTIHIDNPLVWLMYELGYLKGRRRNPDYRK